MNVERNQNFGKLDENDTRCSVTDREKKITNIVAKTFTTLCKIIKIWTVIP